MGSLHENEFLFRPFFSVLCVRVSVCVVFVLVSSYGFQGCYIFVPFL